MVGIPKKQPPPPTLYTLFRLPPGADAERIHGVYIAIASDMHNMGNFAPEFTEVTLAWGVLKDPARRRQYDAQLEADGYNCRRCLGKGELWQLKARGYVDCKECGGTGRRTEK